MAKLSEAEEYQRYMQMTEYEQRYYDSGVHFIAGVDEAGRGPLAGPLAIAAVILPRDAFIPGLNDSKKLSAKKRDELYDKILQAATAVSVNLVSVGNIDRLNIYAATKAGMGECLKHLQIHPDVALVDAMEPKAGETEIVPIVHGDARSVSIAAASIIAKVTRDRIMVELDGLYPEYGFATHKGYGSAKHMAAIRQYGATIWHRRSYEPVKSLGLAPVPGRGNELYSPLSDTNYHYSLE